MIKIQSEGTFLNYKSFTFSLQSRWDFILMRLGNKLTKRSNNEAITFSERVYALGLQNFNKISKKKQNFNKNYENSESEP